MSGEGGVGGGGGIEEQVVEGMEDGERLIFSIEGIKCLCIMISAPVFHGKYLFVTLIGSMWLYKLLLTYERRKI